MSLTPAERTALADVRDEIDRCDPQLAAAFDRLRPRTPRWCWLAWAAGLCLAAGAVALLGMLAVGGLAMVLVLGSPLVAVLTFAGGDGPGSGQKDPPRP